MPWTVFYVSSHLLLHWGSIFYYFPKSNGGGLVPATTEQCVLCTFDPLIKWTDPVSKYQTIQTPRSLKQARGVGEWLASRSSRQISLYLAGKKQSGMTLVWAWWHISQSDATGACDPLSNYFKPRLRLAKNVHRAQSVRFAYSPAFIREAFASISTCRDPLDTSA